MSGIGFIFKCNYYFRAEFLDKLACVESKQIAGHFRPIILKEKQKFKGFFFIRVCEFGSFKSIYVFRCDIFVAVDCINTREEGVDR